ncbi:MAG: threonine--tRNA ligase [Myxococcales bacterium]|nr:threonine--tRNA ligase [Myxococcales bacterium]
MSLSEQLESRPIAITLPDGTVLQRTTGTTALAVAESISGGLAREAVSCKVDGVVRDLSTPLTSDCTLEILKFGDADGQHVFRHSTAHLLAQAVLHLFPEAKPTIGPVVEEGFYYDFAVERPFTPEDLERIEAEMQRLVKERYVYERSELTKGEALEAFKDNPFKVEIINELPADAIISAYRQGDFFDLCRGPHVQHTGQLKAVKVLKVAGAYWRGDAEREQLQRIYGISFTDKKELKQHLWRLEQAKLRDHRRIGKEMELFSFHGEGPGFPFWHAKGMRLRNVVVNYWRELHQRDGYEEIATPAILNEELWHRSGHWANYKDNMYFTSIDEGAYAVKPMNCPGGLLVFNARRHSYRELPIRNAELGTVHRHELSGVLHGLFRVRSFTQDDAHIFCVPEQIRDEVVGVINLIFEIYRTFGFRDVRVELSTRPEKSIGSDEMWQDAEAALQAALEHLGLDYQLNPGDGAFYGPKIDFHIRDCMGRSWQCGTVQCDFSMPQRFEAYYEGSDGERHHPVMLHRAAFGSLERFIGIVIEHFAGKFPLWLAPVQCRVLSLVERVNEATLAVDAQLRAAGLRSEADVRNESLNRKVREAQLDRVNYQLVVGDREAENGTVSVRNRRNKQLGVMTIAEVIAMMQSEIAARTIDEDELNAGA